MYSRRKDLESYLKGGTYQLILKSSDSSSDGLLSAGDFTTVSEVLDPQIFATAICNRAYGLTVRWYVCKDQIPTLTEDWCQIFTNVVVADRIREAHIHKPLGTIRLLPGPFGDGNPTPPLPYPDRWVFDNPGVPFPTLPSPTNVGYGDATSLRGRNRSVLE